MPIKEAAKKYLRQTKKHRVLNLARQKTANDLIKKIKKLALAGQKEEAKKIDRRGQSSDWQISQKRRDQKEYGWQTEIKIDETIE